MDKNSPKRSVDQFLAAPDEVVQNPREKQKLLERKAHDEARKARERATKSQERPSIEDILGDMVRVAEDPVTNPKWHEWRTLSKRRYERFGHYPIEFITRQFGTFEHAKQAAGLATPVGERAFARAQAERSKCDHDERYMRRYVLPHVDKFPELTRETTGWQCVLVISDLHGLYLDPFTWEVFLDVAEDMCPDVVYLNGDVIDCHDISSHPKIPQAQIPLQLEFDFARACLREIRARIPADTRLVWGAGNHFLDRLVRYLTQVSKEIAGLRALRLDNLLELGDLDVDLVQGGTFLSPKGSEHAQPRRVLWDRYLVTHGTKLGRYPAAAELAQWGMSGTSGHVHRASLHFGSTHAHRGLTWMSTPMACTEDAGRNYIKDHIGWQKGFGIAMISGDRVHHYPVVTDSGLAIVEGRAYERGELPTADPAVRAWWLDRFSLDPKEYL